MINTTQQRVIVKPPFSEEEMRYTFTSISMSRKKSKPRKISSESQANAFAKAVKNVARK